MRTILVCLFAMLTFGSCKKKDDAGAAKTMLKVKYGTDVRQAMDIYLPANRNTATTPVLILIHGGGWTEGSRSDLNAVVDTLQRRMPDYAICNISYRLAANGQNIFPAQENDVKAAVEFIFNKQTEYGISNHFALLGASAGAHLALLHTYKYSSPVKIKAVVSFFGPTELVQMYNNPPNPLIPLLLAGVTGGTPTSNSAIYQQSSPYNFVVAGASPTLLLHGSNDVVVAASQSSILHDKLNSVSVPNQYVLYPGAGHGDWTSAVYTDAFLKVETFIKQYNP
ncbi:alpha/beta hydrolase [Lacibacter luteus]|nr:alpha/beta hydrolase [Lacibacter luteus]